MVIFLPCCFPDFVVLVVGFVVLVADSFFWISRLGPVRGFGGLDAFLVSFSLCAMASLRFCSLVSLYPVLTFFLFLLDPGPVQAGWVFSLNRPTGSIQS